VPATRNQHPAKLNRPPQSASFAVSSSRRLIVPEGVNEAEVGFAARKVRLTNLEKEFWPDLHITKRDLLQYYADMSEYLLPHLKDRAMVMKRYPNGAGGEFFFQKRVPIPHPPWIQTCSILHSSGNEIDFPVVQNVETLLWVVNLGCIDLNQWYAKCDDVDRPDYLHFDLDPTPGAEFPLVLETALAVRDTLTELKIPSYAKTTGSRGIHLYVPIKRGPTQKEVWTFAKATAQTLAGRHPNLMTAEYKVKKRPDKRVLVDYNQNAWGRTLASVYSVRPQPLATVSTPVTWKEIEQGIRIEDFRMENVPERVRKAGDVYRPLLLAKNRIHLERFL
jgi:bifunctional non-homologous end joining protein LigD